jgi:uncharacterized protein (TIGR03663 family)
LSKHHKTLTFLLLTLITIGALALRTTDLDLRPMHTDEAIQADILRNLKETGNYTYRPEDYHGPVLIFSALPLTIGKTYTDITERDLRLVPAIYGIALVLLTFLFRRWLGTIPALIAAALTAISPMMVFYSRYFIMELPMLCFLAGFLITFIRYLETKQLPWLLIAAACGALMHATKETFVLSMAAMFPAIIALFLTRTAKFPKLPIKHLIIGAAFSLFLSAAIFSNFFQNPKAIADSYTTYFGYSGRAEGSGHEKPWHYYIKLLTWTKMEGRFLWSEALVIGLAAAGAIAAFLWKTPSLTTQRFTRFLAVYAVTTLVIYSIIPYKTPWSIMCFLHACILLAGYGAHAILTALRLRGLQVIASILLLAAATQLTAQTLRANFPSKKGRLHLYADENRNPYLYSQTTRRLITKIVETVKEIAETDTPILIVHPETAWPLPWYFRAFTKVGYFTDTSQLPEKIDVPILIIDETYAADINTRLTKEYVKEFANLREDSLLILYIEQSLFDQMVEQRSKSH